MKKLLLLLFVVSVGFVPGFSAQRQARKPYDTNSIGKFDIAKVRSAVAGKSNAFSVRSGSDLPETPSLANITIRMVLWLSIILLVLVGSVYAFKRFFYKRGEVGIQEGVMNVLETTSLMPGKSLSLVKIADRVLLLGVFHEGIRCLTEFDGERAAGLIKTTGDGQTGKPMTQFSDSLNMFLERFKQKNMKVR